jgi:hypothetical protein
MGLGSFLFGKNETRWQEVPDIQRYINALMNFNPGIGKAAKWAKQDLRRLRAGEDAASFGQIRGVLDNYAVAQREGERAASMAGQAYGMNPVLQQALQNKQRLALQDSRGHAVGQAIVGLQDSLSGTLNQAHQFRQGMRLNALQGATSAKLNSGQWIQQRKPGLFDYASQIGGLASLFMGIPGLSGGGGIGSGAMAPKYQRPGGFLARTG